MSSFAVKYRAEASAAAVEALETRLGVTAVRAIAPLGVRVYELSAAQAAAFETEEIVEYVEEDQPMGIA